MDAYLVEIESKAEDDFIIEKAMSLASRSGDGLDYWMGAQDSDGDGVWNWATSGQFFMCLQNTGAQRRINTLANCNHDKHDRI